MDCYYTVTMRFLLVVTSYTHRTDFFQRGDKVDIADNSKGIEHINCLWSQQHTEDRSAEIHYLTFTNTVLSKTILHESLPFLVISLF